MLWALQAHRSWVTGVHFEGRDIVTRGLTGELSRWQLPALPSPSSIDDLLRCLPLRFDEDTGSLVGQPPCGSR